MKVPPSMKINTAHYLIMQLILTLGPLLFILITFADGIFYSDKLLLSIPFVIITAFFILLVLSYFLSPALVYVALQEGRQKKTTTKDALSKTKHLRLKMFKLRFNVMGEFLSKLLPSIFPAFAYVARISLWPYYLVDKNVAENAVLSTAYIESGKDAANLFGKTVVFSRGWWHALEYLHKQKA